jgi:hypothetical protein
MRQADAASSPYEREKEMKFARIAYDRLCSECNSMTEKQVQRDSPEAYQFWKYGVPGL